MPTAPGRQRHSVAEAPGRLAFMTREAVAHIEAALAARRGPDADDSRLPFPDRPAGGAVAAAGAISVVSLGYVIFLNSGVDFERRYATSGLAAVVLLAFWLFMTNALILVGFQIAQEV